MPADEQVIAFPVHPGVTPLDLIGPLTVLRTPGIGGERYRTVVVGERAESLATVTPLQLRLLRDERGATPAGRRRRCPSRCSRRSGGVAVPRPLSPAPRRG